MSQNNTVSLPKLKHPLIIVGGTTASGKSATAIEIAKKIGGYVINADSRQIYAELKIGAAQPVADKVNKKTGAWTIDGVDHFLFGHMNVTDEYNLFIFKNQVFKVLSQNPKRPAILTGGTGLYIDAVIKDFGKKDDGIESQKFSQKNLEHLTLEQLQELVPKRELKKLNDSDRKNPVRLIGVIRRGLPPKSEVAIDHIYIVIDQEPEKLEKRITERTQEMFEAGLVEENLALWEKYQHRPRAFQSIGYHEFIDLFHKRTTKDEVQKRIGIHTKQYAKRQRTWFRRAENAHWVKNSQEALDVIGKEFKSS